MDASQYKDYILTLLFVKYVSDKAKTDPASLIDVPKGGSAPATVPTDGSTWSEPTCGFAARSWECPRI
jgi:type I restriction enzyme M protein